MRFWQNRPGISAPVASIAGNNSIHIGAKPLIYGQSSANDFAGTGIAFQLPKQQPLSGEEY